MEEGPRFSFPPEEPEDGGRLRDLSEIDDDVRAAYARLEEKLRNAHVADNLTREAAAELADRWEKEEVLKFVEEFPEKAASYTEVWKNWTKKVGIYPEIERDEWEHWCREHSNADYMDQYRSIAWAYWGM